MPPILVFEDSQVPHLYPLCLGRAPCELPLGAGTILEQLQRNLPGPIAGLLVRPALAETLRRRTGLPVNAPQEARDGFLLVNARLLLNEPLAMPEADTAGLAGAAVAWINLSPKLAADLNLHALHESRTLEALLPLVQRRDARLPLVAFPWELLAHQHAAILRDFGVLGPATPAQTPPGVYILKPEQTHIGDNVQLMPGVVLDATAGPIIIGRDVQVRAHATITGPVSIGAGCIIRTGADIREDCVFGPGCRVGGEVIGSVLLGNVNKQHDGFLGQSIVGEWANLGAGTITSNLKNTYGSVRVLLNGTERETGRQFLGSIIGDHVKIGIGTCLTTGTIIGYGSHVTMPRPPKFVPSFSWATGEGIARANFEKIEQVAAMVMARRHVDFTAADHELMVAIANASAQTEQFAWREAAL